MPRTLKVLVTNSASKTVFSFLPMLCSGDVFGQEQKLHLVLFAFKPLNSEVEALASDLSECCFPALEKIEATSDMKRAFEGIDVAILLELERNVIGFKTNSVLFRAYGLLINTRAKKDVKVLVCGMTANTSAFICSSFAPSITPHNFTVLAQHIKYNITSTMMRRNASSSKERFPTSTNETIAGKDSKETKDDDKDENGDVIEMTDDGRDIKDIIVWGSCSNLAVSVHENGMHIHKRDIESGLKSPGALVTAKAMVEHLRYWLGGEKYAPRSNGQQKGAFCMGVLTSVNHLGVENDLYFNLPVCPEKSPNLLEFSKNLKLDDSLTEALARISEQISKERDRAIVDCWRVVFPHSHM